jgi:hypothetical protein
MAVELQLSGVITAHEPAISVQVVLALVVVQVPTVAP